MSQPPENQQQYGSILTILGENAEQNGKLKNKQITFTHIAIGDANDQYVQPDRKQTALVNELARIPVNSVDVLQPTPDSTPMLKVEAILPDDVNDLIIREFAAVATFDGNTYFHAVGNCARIYVPAPVNNGNVSTPVTLEMIFVITSAEPIVEMDPNVVTASRDYVNTEVDNAVSSIMGDKVWPPKGSVKIGDKISSPFKFIRLNNIVYRVDRLVTGDVEDIVSDVWIVVDGESYELINNDDWESRARGEVEGYRRHYPDDTDCFDNALKRSAFVVNAEMKRVYNVKGGVLYVRNGQSVNLNKAVVRLVDNAGVYRKNIFEMDTDSELFNGVIDGNYQNNIDDILDWPNLEDVPYAHGVYTSRLQTNNETFAASYRAICDKLKIRNTIRSNIVFAGSDQYHGKLTLQGSYCDHHIYWSNAENIRYSAAYLSGFARSEMISMGTDFKTKADVGGGDLTVIANVVKSPYDAQYPAHEPCYLKFRNTGLGLSASFGIVKIKDLSSQRIDDTGRVWVEPGWNININQYVLEKTLSSDSGVVTYTIPLEVRGSSLYIADFKSTQDGDIEKNNITSSIYAHEGANVTIDNANLEVHNPSSALNTIRQIISKDSDVFISSLNSKQSSGYLFRPEGLSRSAVITVGRITRAEGFDKFNYPLGIHTRDVKILHRDRVSLVGNTPLSPTKKIDPSKTELVDLGNVGGGIYGFERNDVYMSKIVIIGDGVTSLESSEDIIYKNPESIPRVTVKNERLEFLNLFSNKWIEI